MEFWILPKRYGSFNQKYSFSPRANGAYISLIHDSCVLSSLTGHF